MTHKEINLLENFEGNGADGIVKTPIDWTKGTGKYKVGEYVKGGSERFTFDTGLDGFNKVSADDISTFTHNIDKATYLL